MILLSCSPVSMVSLLGCPSFGLPRRSPGRVLVGVDLLLGAVPRDGVALVAQVCGYGHLTVLDAGAVSARGAFQLEQGGVGDAIVEREGDRLLPHVIDDEL